jgi:hypothetical protein
MCPPQVQQFVPKSKIVVWCGDFPQKPVYLLVVVVVMVVVMVVVVLVLVTTLY